MQDLALPGTGATMKSRGLSISVLLLPLQLFANGGPYGSGTSLMNEMDLKGQDSQRERQDEQYRKSRNNNQRSGRGTQGHREEMEDDQFIDNYGNGETTNRKFDR